MLQKIICTLLTTLLTIGLFFQADAQTWSKTFSEIEQGSANSRRIMVSDEGEIFIDEAQAMPSSQVVRIRKIDSEDGIEISSNTLEIPLTTVYFSTFGSSDLSNDGIVSAYTAANSNGLTLILRKLSTDLSILDEETTTYADSNVYYNQARWAGDNVLILGSTEPESSSIASLTLTKIDSDGEVSWLKMLEGGSTPWLDYDIIARNIEVSSSGHILVSALFYDESTFAECSVLSFDYDRLIILCDENGDEIWRYDGDEYCQYDNFPKAIFTNTNEIIVGCGDYDADFEPPFENEQGFYVPTLTKLNLTGEELWRVPIGEHGISASVLSVVETENGDFIAVGTRFSLAGGQQEGFVAKVSTNGEVLWNRNYRYAPDRPSYLYDVAILSDGRIACSGYTEESVWSNKSSSWVMVLDQDGCLEEDCGMNVSENPQSPFTIYPNPATNQLNLSWSTTAYGNALVRMTTLEGKIVLDEETNASQPHTIDTSALAEGFYLLTVQMNNQWFVEKVVIRGE